MIELLFPCGFNTLEYSWVRATIAICTLADYSMAKKCQQFPQHPLFSASSSLKTSAIHFKDLDFIVDHSDNMSPSIEEGNSDTVVGGMAHSGSPSLHAILYESPSTDDLALSEGESSGSPLMRVCNTVMPTIPIMTTLPPKETPVLQTIPMRP
jgi:hypothetical protein